MSRRRWLHFYLPAFLVECGIFMLVLAQPIDALARFGATPLQLGLLGMLANGGYALTAIGAGRWSDRLGRRGLMIIGLAGPLALALALPLTGNFSQLLALATLQLTLLGCFWAPFMGALSDSVRPAGLSAVLGWFNISWCLGSIGASVANTLLYNQYGTRAPYWGAALFLMAALLIVALGHPRRRPQPEEHTHPLHPRVGYFKAMAWLALAANFFMAGMLIYLFPRLASAEPLSLVPAQIAFLHVLRLLAMLATFWLMGATVRWHFQFGAFHASYALLVAAMLLTALLRLPILMVLPFVAVGVAMGMAYGLSVYYSALEQARGSNLGVHEALLAIGSTSGPIYGGLLMQASPWPPLAFIGGALLLAAVWLTSAWLHHHRHPSS